MNFNMVHLKLKTADENSEESQTKKVAELEKRANGDDDKLSK